MVAHVRARAPLAVSQLVNLILVVRVALERLVRLYAMVGVAGRVGVLDLVVDLDAPLVAVWHGGEGALRTLAVGTVPGDVDHHGRLVRLAEWVMLAVWMGLVGVSQLGN